MDVHFGDAEVVSETKQNDAVRPSIIKYSSILRLETNIFIKLCWQGHLHKQCNNFQV